MDPVDALAQAILGVGRVIAHAVVGAIRQDRVDGALVPALLGQRIGGDALRNRLGLELFRWNRPDDAVAIARRHQEHRDAARVHQALLDRLVAIAVAQGDFVVADTGAHDGAVGCGRAVGHRVRAVRAKHARRVALALAHRTAVAEHRAERTALDAHVGAEQVFTEEIEEHATDRRLQECDAALVARRRPGVLALAVVARERRGIRRQQV